MPDPVRFETERQAVISAVAMWQGVDLALDALVQAVVEREREQFEATLHVVREHHIERIEHYQDLLEDAREAIARLESKP